MFDHWFDLGHRDLGRGRNRVGHHHATGKTQGEPSAVHRGHAGGVVNPVRDRQPAAAAVERGELIGAEPEHRDAQGVEELQRLGQVEERLRAGGHGDNRMTRQCVQVRAHIAAEMVVAVHAADAAGREHGDAGQSGKGDRSGDGRHADVPALRDGDRQVALGALAGPVQDTLVVGRVDADAGNTIDHRGQRRDRPTGPDRRRASGEDLSVEGDRKPERARDRRLEGDDRLAVGERVGNLGMDDEHGGGSRGHGRRRYPRCASIDPCRAADGPPLPRPWSRS